MFPWTKVFRIITRFLNTFLSFNEEKPKQIKWSEETSLVDSGYVHNLIEPRILMENLDITLRLKLRIQVIT